MKNIYYVVGSYNHPIGSVDYINALKIFFNKTNKNINLIISTKIIKNGINIFLESFNEDYIKYMKEIKNKYQKTKYIIICTEFIQICNNRMVFNCFSEKDFEDENVLSSNENFINTKIINNDLVIKSKNNFENVGRRIIRKFGNQPQPNNSKPQPNELNDSNLIQNSNKSKSITDRRKEFHLRSNCLNEIIKYSDFLLAAHPEITKSISNHIKKPCFDFPFYVPEINVDIFNKKINGFYLGGTLNDHRQIFVKNLGKSIINMNTQEIYETFIGHSNNPLYRKIRKSSFNKILLEIKIKADLEDLSKELNEKIQFERSSQSEEDNTMKILKKVKADFYPDSIETLLKEYIILYIINQQVLICLI